MIFYKLLLLVLPSIFIACNDANPLTDSYYNDTITIIDSIIINDTIETIKTDTIKITKTDTIKILVEPSSVVQSSSSLSSSTMSSSGLISSSYQPSSSSSSETFIGISKESLKDISGDTLIEKFKDYEVVYSSSSTMKVFIDSDNKIERDTLLDSNGSILALRVCDRKSTIAINYYNYEGSFKIYFRYYEDSNSKQFIFYSTNETVSRTVEYNKNTKKILDNRF